MVSLFMQYFYYLFQFELFNIRLFQTFKLCVFNQAIGIKAPAYDCLTFKQLMKTSNHKRIKVNKSNFKSKSTKVISSQFTKVCSSCLHRGAPLNISAGQLS